jgi:hypothetical protein
MNINTWKQIKSGAFLLAASFCVVLTGCSFKPSEGDGQQAVQNQINQQAQGRIRLISFHKTNGQMAEINAVKVYSLEFQSEIEFTENCKWAIGNYGQQLSFQTSKPVTQQQGGVWGQFLDNAVANPGVLANQGQRVQLFGVIHFEKKENGWSVDNVELTKYVAENAPQSTTGTTPGGQSQSSGVQNQTQPSIPPPAKPDQGVLDALADVERDYSIDLVPLPESGELALVSHSGGIHRIQFAEPDFQHGKIKAVIGESIFDTSVGKIKTNSVSLVGKIQGGQLNLTGSDPNTSIAMVLRESYRTISGEYKSGQNSGTVKVNFGDSYLHDSDPRISYSLVFIRTRGQDVFKAAKFSNGVYHFPDASPVKDSPYVYIPGMVMPLNDFGKDKRILLFQKPSPSMRVIPIYGLDQVVRKVSPEELERLIKEQTGKSVDEILRENEAASEQATSAAWAEFDQVAPKTPLVQQAMDFSTEGIKLGETLSQIKAKLPSLQSRVITNSLSTDDVNLEGYWGITRERGLSDASWVEFHLHGGRVYQMQINYTLEDVNKLGGWQAVLSDLKDKLGEPDSTSRGIGEFEGKQTASYAWKFPDAYRAINFQYTESRGFLRVSAANTKF